MEKIKIRTPFIKLDQLLKFAGLVESGGEAKDYILAGQVELNQNVVIERGKKIYPGDSVTLTVNDEKHVIQVE